MSNELFSTSARAKTECTVLKITYNQLQNIRNQFQNLDEVMTHYEKYVENSDPPICDYKLYRYKAHKMSSKKRLIFGIRRLNRIIRSYQTYEIQELLNLAKFKAIEKHEIEELKRKSHVLKRAPINIEERNEQALLQLHVKIDDLSTIIDQQK